MGEDNGWRRGGRIEIGWWTDGCRKVEYTGWINMVEDVVMEEHVISLKRIPSLPGRENSILG